jgi:hypothetical protein
VPQAEQIPFERGRQIGLPRKGIPAKSNIVDTAVIIICFIVVVIFESFIMYDLIIIIIIIIITVFI